MSDYKQPVYIVACPVSLDYEHADQPLLEVGKYESFDAALSLDNALALALPALWYALHLPRTRWDTIDLSISAIRGYLSQQAPAAVVLVPVGLMDEPRLFRALREHFEPIMILCPDTDRAKAYRATAQFKLPVPPLSYLDLTQENLDRHWSTLESLWAPDWPSEAGIVGDPRAPVFEPLSEGRSSALTIRRLKRLLEITDEAAPLANKPGEDALQILYIRAWIEAAAELEQTGMGVDTPDIDESISQKIREVARYLRLPLTISLPGRSSRYARFASPPQRHSSAGDHTSNRLPLPFTPAPAESELEAISALVAHRATSTESMAINFPEIPPAAFHALADLERHWVEGPVPSKERRLREKLDATMKYLWTPEVLEVLGSTSQIDAFTNFPIGILRPPGFTAPLASQLAIAYHPLSPLTRAVQLEIKPPLFADFSAGFKVLIAECIPSTDPVGAASRRGWSTAVENLPDPARGVSVFTEEISSTEQLREALATHRPDVLVLSAHGYYDPSSNAAGLIIGEELSFGNDLGEMPPLVILSACHSAPRGGSAVAVADLVLRAGAVAVVSTLVPVHVVHNSIFMTRFLLYLSETIGHVEEHSDVLQVWHRVQSSNVIVDIANGNDQLTLWAYRQHNGVSPLEDFMNGRSSGRLRPEHRYHDAERVLLEIAAEQGVQDQIRRWMATPGYLTEGMMYTIIGDPTAIRLRQ